MSADIDVLIGAELFWSVVCIGQIRASPSHPTLQKTRFGWILAGRFGNHANNPRRVQAFHASVSNTQLHDQLARFWQLKNIDRSINYTEEESRCENDFLQNVTRTSQGRYVVKLPFKQAARNRLGNSKDIALKRLLGLEKRLERNPELKAHYIRFLREYLSLGHMKQIETFDDEKSSPSLRF